MSPMRDRDSMPPEALLALYPDPMRAIAEHLREIVRRVAPDAIERVRTGWRLIGYDLPITPRRTVYFGWVAPESGHVHLGFEHGVAMEDPDGVLLGAGITKRVRWVTLRRDADVDDRRLEGLVREGIRVATLSPAERHLLRLQRETELVASGRG
jgi:hypothetical protein